LLGKNKDQLKITNGFDMLGTNKFWLEIEANLL
jgi:hypothetical protein